MQLTRAADYGVRVMIQLATEPDGDRALLPDLAKATGAPESFLSKVLQALARAGLITSRRGQAGGFRITTRGRQASMLDVIEAVDGAIRLNVCLVTGRSCSRKVRCPAHPVWAKAQEAMVEILSNATVTSLATATSSTPAADSARLLPVLNKPAHR